MYLPNVRNKPVLPPELRSPQPRTSRDDAGPSQSGTSTDSASSSNGGEQQRKLVMAEVSNLHQFLLKKATTMYTPNLRNQPVLPPELHGLLFPGTSELPSVPTVEVRSRVGQHQRQFHPYLDTRLAGSFDPANLRRLARQDPGSQTDDADAAKTSNLGGANQHQGNPPGRHDDPGNNPDLDGANLHQGIRPIGNINPANNHLDGANLNRGAGSIRIVNNYFDRANLLQRVWPNGLIINPAHNHSNGSNLHPGTWPNGNAHPVNIPNSSPARSGSLAESHPVLTEVLGSPPMHPPTMQFRDALETPPLNAPTTRVSGDPERRNLPNGVERQSTEAEPSSSRRDSLETRASNTLSEKRKLSTGVAPQSSGAGPSSSYSRTDTTSLQSPQKKQFTSKQSEVGTNQLSTSSSSGHPHVLSFEDPSIPRSRIEDRFSATATTGGDTPMVLSPGSPSSQTPPSSVETADESTIPMIGSEVHSISSSDVLLLQSDDSQQVPETSHEDTLNVPSSFIIQADMPSTSQSTNEKRNQSTQESSDSLAGKLEDAGITSPQENKSPSDLTVPEIVPLPRMPSLGDLFRPELFEERVPLPRMLSLGDLFRQELFEDDNGILRDRRCLSTGSLRQQVLVSEQQSSNMTRGISQPSSETCHSSETDISSEVTQSSISGQTVDPSQQVQSTGGERNDAVAEISEPSRSTPESTSSGISCNTGESISSEQADGSSQQVPSEGTATVGAGEPSRALQSDISGNTSQSSSSEGSVPSTTKQQKLVSKHRRKYVLADGKGMGNHEASPRDISRSICQILGIQSDHLEPTVQEREQRNTDVIDEIDECRCRARLSQPLTPSEDTAHRFRSNQSEEARAIIPEGIVNNAIRNFDDGLVNNPASRLSGVPSGNVAYMRRSDGYITAHQARRRREEEMLDRLARRRTQEFLPDNDRRAVRGRGKQCFPKDVAPRGDGGGGGK